MSAPLMHVGATKETVAAARDVVFAILDRCSGDSALAIEALRTFRDICETGPLTVSRCNFNAAPAKNRSRK